MGRVTSFSHQHIPWFPIQTRDYKDKRENARIVLSLYSTTNIGYSEMLVYVSKNAKICVIPNANAKICFTPNANPKLEQVEYRERWVPNARGWH